MKTFHGTNVANPNCVSLLSVCSAPMSPNILPQMSDIHSSSVMFVLSVLPNVSNRWSMLRKAALRTPPKSHERWSRRQT